MIQIKGASPKKHFRSQTVNKVVFPDQALYDAGVKIKGTDVNTWISIMSQRSVPHLRKGNPLPHCWII